MLLIRHIILYILLAFSFVSFSQQAYKGIVFDNKTKEPVPFASIRLAGKETGMIANEDGSYYLPASIFHKTDSILVSSVGYMTRKLSIRSLKDTANVGLTPLVYDLKEVSISATGQPDYLYRLFFESCQRYRNIIKSVYSKAYFSFMSECDNEPLEIIEGYYNAEVSAGNGISQLLPKNGRIGLTLRNFWSLNTTDILKHLLPFTSGGHHTVPLSPGNLSYHRFREIYTINLEKNTGVSGNRSYILRIVPKYDSLKIFGCRVYINEKDQTIDRLEYSVKNVDFYYLRTPIQGDIVDSVNLAWSVTIDNSDKDYPTLARMSLDYSLRYIEQQDSHKTSLSANAELIFYDFNRPYLNTLGYLGDQPNDYQRIMSIPYDPVFWLHPGVTPESSKQSRFREFFAINGVLLNYKPGLNSYVRSAYLPWTSDRNLECYELGTAPAGSKTVDIPASRGKNEQRKNSQILGLIMINPVVISDSLHISSVTMVNARGSYLNEIQSYRAAAFINTIFDLYELKRREIVNRFNKIKYGSQAPWDEFRNLYIKETSNLQDSIQLLYKETWDGSNVDMILKWYTMVSSKLGIERTALMQRMLSEDREKRNRKKPKK